MKALLMVAALGMLAPARVVSPHTMRAMNGASARPAATIPVKVSFSAPSVHTNDTETLNVQTSPGARILLQVLYPASGGFKKKGRADAHGSWVHSWQVHSSHAGQAMIKLAIDVGKQHRNYSKTFTIVSVATPTAVPTSTPTTSFTANWSAGISAWQSAGTGTWSVNGGALTYDGAGESTIIAPYQGTPTNYFIDANIQLVHTPTPNSNGFEGDQFGILFRAKAPFDPAGSGDKTGLGAGWIHATLSGADALHQATIGTVELNSHFYAPQVDFQPGTVAHDYRLEVRGNGMQVFVDGHLAVTQANVSQYFDSTRVGLYSRGDQIRVLSYQIGALSG